MLLWTFGAFFLTGLFSGDNSKEAAKTATDVTGWWVKMVLIMGVGGILLFGFLGIRI